MKIIKNKKLPENNENIKSYIFKEYGILMNTRISGDRYYKNNNLKVYFISYCDIEYCFCNKLNKEFKKDSGTEIEVIIMAANWIVENIDKEFKL